MKDLHELPKLRDSLSYLYLEHAIINQKHKAIEYINWEGRTLIPVANLSVLMLGPGTTISHAAIKALAGNGCLTIWTGADSTRYYAHGTGETRRAYHLLKQTKLVSNEKTRLKVAMRMYKMRFDEELDSSLTLQQIRGHEGVRMRQAYAAASKKYGVAWYGRRYDRSNWGGGDPVNRALSTANAMLNGMCHTAIVSGGYSPALGFIHTGKQLSFVYDIADLYKTEITIPLAFRTAARYTATVGKKVREACRQSFKEAKLMQRILPDIETLLATESAGEQSIGDVDADGALPEPLWDPPSKTGGLI